MSDADDVARAFVAALVRGGVREAVLAPGSRSAGLALALHQADRDGLVRLHVRIDERSAGFLALGLARAGRRPAVVVTTSGTAVANLHPALLEARHAGLPLVAVTADRPAALRGTGANQTTFQVGMFGPQVPCTDVVGAVDFATVLDRAFAGSGPAQVNVQLVEPLLPELPLDLRAAQPAQPARATAEPGRGPYPGAGPENAGPLVLPAGRRTVVVAGDDAGPGPRLLAERAGWPLLAEPTSGSRAGDNAVRTYRLLLAGDLGERVERVLVTGHPTLSRPVTRLISRPDIEVLSVCGPGGTATDPGRVATRLPVLPNVDRGSDPSWLAEWRQRNRELSARLDSLVADDAEAEPLRVAAEVARALVPGALLMVGSSQPVRDLDLMMTPYRPGERRMVIGNRGLAGIDGTLSTAIGAALARPGRRALAYLGDLTFLHDVNALVSGPQEPLPDLTVVVANDDGGAIFATLEQGAPEYAGAFERVFATPHGVDLRALCAATGTAYERAETMAGLRQLLGTEPTGLRVVEVRIGRAGRRRLAAAIAALGAGPGAARA